MSALYRALVTTYMRSAGTMGSSRSAVIWMRVRPRSRMSRNCFGRPERLIGQKREPTPPAMMTA